MISRGLGLALGFAADRVLGDPARFHPVAGFGRLAAHLEHRWYADSRRRGAWHTTVLVGGAVVAGSLVERRGGFVVRTVAMAATTWAVIGGRSLGQEARAVAALADSGDLPGARARVRSLVGRDTSVLSVDDLARAVTESVAENTSDAIVAPLWWGAVAGLGGLAGYRAVNTLDAMVGHRSQRYRDFGWASARLDDLANLVPARLSALLAVASAPSVGGRRVDAWRAWRRDAPGHPSPNAGPVEAAFAGALGLRFGGVNHYGGIVDDRPGLGDGPAPRISDVERVVQLASLVGQGALATSLGLVAVRWFRGDRARPARPWDR